MYPVLNVHTHFSLLLSTIKPKNLADHLKNVGCGAAAITDYNSLSGTVTFHKDLKDAGIKPILGCRVVVRLDDDETQCPLTLLCKNLNGWYELVKLLGRANLTKNWEKSEKAVIDWNNLCDVADTKNLIAISDRNWSDFSDVFEEDFYQGIYGFTQDCATVRNSPFKKVALADPHYISKDEAGLHRILLSTHLKTTLANLEAKAAEDAPWMKRFIHFDKFYIPSKQEFDQVFTKEELAHVQEIADKCELYDIKHKPRFPAFECPDNKTPDEYLRLLCVEGWKQKIRYNDNDEKLLYGNRVKEELAVLKEAGLASYFLVVKDIIDFVKKNGWLTGAGRGSVGGCITAYLTGITQVNPIPYKLVFERFYNSGRNSPGRIALPDIDIDIPVDKRTEVIQYIKTKYGEDKVAQMITFQTIKGRAAIKDVLRAYGSLSYEEINKITEFIPDQASIADELEEMRKAEGESSIIKWSLENETENLKEWCYYNSEGKLDGPLALRFDQAIKLEGIKSAASKHAAGVIVSDQALLECCPMVYDEKTEKPIVAVEMNDAESLGFVKMDILGIAALDKMMKVTELLRV